MYLWKGGIRHNNQGRETEVNFIAKRVPKASSGYRILHLEVKN